MDALMLDGNAVAGLLQEVFAVEMTTAIATCSACDAAGAIGATQVFRGAGVVLSCPHCGNVLATIVEADTRMWMGLGGIRTLQMAMDLGSGPSGGRHRSA
jgi:hypothetical protein